MIEKIAFTMVCIDGENKKDSYKQKVTNPFDMYESKTLKKICDVYSIVGDRIPISVFIPTCLERFAKKFD